MAHTSDALLTEYADQLRARIDAALRTYVELTDGCPAELREAIEYSLLGPGKRLRPMLVLMACQACGGAIEAALPAACAVEMIHAYSLVHDDLPAMDNDDLRRGRPTCHKKFGEAMAILAGDALLTLAFEVLAKKVLPPELAAACCAELAAAAGACNLVGGQVDDMQAGSTTGGLDSRSHCGSEASSPGRMPAKSQPSSATADASAWPFRLPTTCSTSAAVRRPSASRSARTRAGEN